MKSRINACAVSTQHGKLALLGLLAASAAALSLLPADKAEAHGYVTGDVKSRTLLCSAAGGEKNTNCGGWEWDAYSVEYNPGDTSFHHHGHGCSDSFMKCGPADGWIASAGKGGSYGNLNEQNSVRWYKNAITPGEHTFGWYYHAGHPIAYTEFYLTKPDWNPNQPLTREAFEAEPIARFGAAGRPTDHSTVNYKVNIPADRKDYHVLLSVWKVGDTSKSFYQVVDLDIQNGDIPQPEWKDVGTMRPETLLPGDKVGVRVFTAQGELPPLPKLLIDSEEKGRPEMWTFELATALNATSTNQFRTGVLDSHGNVVPNHGQNHFYIRPGSPVTNVIVEKYIADLPTQLRLSGLQDNYTSTDGRVNLHYNAVATGNETYTINTAVFRDGKQVAYKVGSVGNQQHFSLALDNAVPGTYDVTAVATVNNEYKASAAHRFTVVEQAPAPEHDFVYPDGQGQYANGTTVLQPKDGNVYECKVAGWCNVALNPADPAYEPGVGRAWETAWSRK